MGQNEMVLHLPYAHCNKPHNTTEDTGARSVIVYKLYFTCFEHSAHTFFCAVPLVTGSACVIHLNILISIRYCKKGHYDILNS